MARSKKRETVDDMLDEVLGADQADLDAVDLDDAGNPIKSPSGEESPLQAREEAEAPEPSDESEGQEADSEGGASADSPAEVEAKIEPESEEDEADEKEPENDLEALRKQNRGLLKQITELRSVKRQQVQPQQPVQPVAAPAPSTTTAPTRKGVTVKVSEDGQSVFVDPSEFDQAVRETAQELIRQAQQPTPEQIRIQQNYRAEAEFVQADSARLLPIVERVHQADDYITSHLRNLIAEGHQVQNVNHAIEIMRSMGIDKEVGQHFPEVEPIFDEFVEGMASGNPTWRKSLLARIAGPANGHESPASPKRVDVRSMPQSLTKKGGVRTEAGTTEEREFKELQDEFNRDVIFFPEKKYKRLEELGSKLGKPGFE